MFGQGDSVQNSWLLKTGMQIIPAPGKNYLSRVVYRLGFHTGPDYIRVGRKLPQTGLSFGLGLPVANYNKMNPGQATLINLAFEYGRRGNSNNFLRENIFRVSAAFSLSDFWFVKRKYE
jgi:hypothetical protein